MNTKIAATIFALATAFSTSAFAEARFFSDDPEIEIKKVSFSGSGCNQNVDNVTLKKDRFIITFERFQVQTGEETDTNRASANCRVNLRLGFPKGKVAMHVHDLELYGTANLGRSDKARVKTTVSLPSGSTSSKTWRNSGAVDDEEVTIRQKFRDKPAVRCQGEDLRMSFNIKMDLQSKGDEDRYIELNRTFGRSATIRVTKDEDCI